MATDDALASSAAAQPATANSERQLPASTLPLYLLGRRRAIEALAESHAALWIGLLFVLSAGFAREYDGADLLHQPWHLAVPLVASLGTSLVLYSLVFIAARSRGLKELRFFDGYRTLLTFYWWTAPLAWLYAIPVERFMTPGSAAHANLWLLAAVSVWRVLLITRAASVWLNASFIGMFFIVMFFADSVAVLLAFVSPKPIFDVMGGIRLSRADQALLDATLTVMVFGSLSWFVWLVGATIVISKRSPQWFLRTQPDSARRASTRLWIVAGLLLVCGFALLPIGQPEQQHRTHTEYLLRSGDLDGAVAYVSQRTRGDFPPVWDPPPRIGYGEDRPPVLEVLESIDAHHAADWFRGFYVEKLVQDPSSLLSEAIPDDEKVDTSRFERILSLLERHVPTDSFQRTEEWYNLRRIADDKRLDGPLRTRLNAYLGTTSDGSE